MTTSRHLLGLGSRKIRRLSAPVAWHEPCVRLAVYICPVRTTGRSLMSNRPRHARVARRAVAVLLSLLLLLPDAVMAAGLGPIQGGALPGPLPLFPSDNWWNLDISWRARRSQLRRLHHLHQQRRHPPAAPRLRRRGISRQRGDLRDALCRGRCHAEQAPGGRRGLLRRERRRGRVLLPDSLTGHHPGALDRGGQPGERGSPKQRGPASPHRGPRQPLSLRALQRLLQRRHRTVGSRRRRLLGHEDEQPPTRGMDLGRCRRARHPARARALRRGVRSRRRRDPARLPRDGAGHQRPRLPGVA